LLVNAVAVSDPPGVRGGLLPRRRAQLQRERCHRLQAHPEADRRGYREGGPQDDDQRRQGYPRKLYGLTEEDREFLEEHNLLAAEETLQQIYETIADKPEKMVKYEKAPRPDN